MTARNSHSNCGPFSHSIFVSRCEVKQMNMTNHQASYTDTGIVGLSTLKTKHSESVTSLTNSAILLTTSIFRKHKESNYGCTLKSFLCTINGALNRQAYTKSTGGTS
jgi:hypothetical protein